MRKLSESSNESKRAKTQYYLLNYQTTKPYYKKDSYQAHISLFGFDQAENMIAPSNFMIISVKV